MAVVKEEPTVSAIPQFVPFGELLYTQDTGDLYIGTGFSTGSDFTAGNPGPNVNVELVSSPGGLPGGFNGDIQYNNNANLGGSAATITAAGTISIPTGQNYEINGVPLSSAWSALTGAMTYTQVAPWYNATSTVDSGISRLGAASLAIGNGTAGDFTGSLQLRSVLITDTAANADLTLENTTVATVSTTNASPLLELAVNYWTGASAQDLWTIGSSITAGVNGQSCLAITHTGTASGYAPVVSAPTFWATGGNSYQPSFAMGPSIGITGNPVGFYLDSSGSEIAWSVSPGVQSGRIGGGIQFVPGGIVSWNPTSAFSGSSDTGISRLGAASLAIGNGTAGDFTGTLKLTTLQMAASGAAPTSAGTAGTAGQIIYNGALAYLCTVTGAAGAATWTKFNLTAV